MKIVFTTGILIIWSKTWLNEYLIRISTLKLVSFCVFNIFSHGTIHNAKQLLLLRLFYTLGINRLTVSSNSSKCQSIYLLGTVGDESQVKKIHRINSLDNKIVIKASIVILSWIEWFLSQKQLENKLKLTCSEKRQRKHIHLYPLIVTKTYLYRFPGGDVKNIEQRWLAITVAVPLHYLVNFAFVCNKK